MLSRRPDWPPLALVALLITAWEVLPRLYGSLNFPPLTTVLAALSANAGEIAAQLTHTLRRAAIGFALAVGLMVPFGIAIARNRIMALAFEPTIDLLRPLPPIAIIPLVILFAGIGDGAKISVICYAASFPILIHTIDGVRGIHPMFPLVSKALRLTRSESRYQVDLRAVMPVVFTGLRLAVANALLVAVTSEMLLSTDGIGLYIMQSQERFRIADGLAGILVVAIVGWLINRLVLAADRRLLGWHYAITGREGREAQ